VAERLRPPSAVRRSSLVIPTDDVRNNVDLVPRKTISASSPDAAPKHPHPDPNRDIGRCSGCRLSSTSNTRPCSTRGTLFLAFVVKTTGLASDQEKRLTVPAPSADVSSARPRRQAVDLINPAGSLHSAGRERRSALKRRCPGPGIRHIYPDRLSGFGLLSGRTVTCHPPASRPCALCVEWRFSCVGSTSASTGAFGKLQLNSDPATWRTPKQSRNGRQVGLRPASGRNGRRLKQLKICQLKSLAAQIVESPWALLRACLFQGPGGAGRRSDSTVAVRRPGYAMLKFCQEARHLRRAGPLVSLAPLRPLYAPWRLE